MYNLPNDNEKIGIIVTIWIVHVDAQMTDVAYQASFLSPLEDNFTLEQDFRGKCRSKGWVWI